MSAKSPFLIGFEETQLTPSLQQHLLAVNPAGIILFKRNIVSLDQARQLIRNIQDLLGEVIVAIDHEGGIVNRFPADTPVPPSPAALFRTGDMEAVRDAARLQAEVLSWLGVNLNFAPVVDLSVNSENDVIGTRAFSSDPTEVANFAKICLEEHRKLHIGTTAKHFPGHGRTNVDSHFASGAVEYQTPDQLNDDLYPYQVMVQAGVPTIMTAHLMYPELDGEVVAGLSHKIITGLLREQLGFRGVIIADCVEMVGISERYSPAEIVRKGLEAGVDLFISSFSLKKSQIFHLELCDAFQKMVDTPSVSDSVLGFRQRCQTFLTNHRCLGSEPKALPELPAALALHQKTLQKYNPRGFQKGYGSYFVVELTQRECQGINAGTPRNIVAVEVQQKSARFRGGRLLNAREHGALHDIVQMCNQKKLTCVLLSVNGLRQEGFMGMIKILELSQSVIHIALLDDQDLTGRLANEWVTWGYNACTGKMLAQALDAAT